MFKDNEVYQIYEYIVAMCGHPDPSEGCRLIANFCKSEMKKIASQQTVEADAESCFECDYFKEQGASFCCRCGHDFFRTA